MRKAGRDRTEIKGREREEDTVKCVNSGGK